jgi:hypothetical protein
MAKKQQRRSTAKSKKEQPKKQAEKPRESVPRMAIAVCPKCGSIRSRLTGGHAKVEYRRCKCCHTGYGVDLL